MVTTQAQLAPCLVTGRWRLYVALFGVSASQWPAYELNPGPRVPSVQERSRALAALGYVFTDGAAWRWAEERQAPDEPDTPVRLFATAEVREAAE
ncbi:DUF6303 family protein [Streptomyces sp. NPDC058572]|uniref:DUF6303 family protein n=1 Tax=Streptomyces sp. NPDC058572 TaxID=3346546 RepID=UPI00365C5983